MISSQTPLKETILDAIKHINTHPTGTQRGSFILYLRAIHLELMDCLETWMVYCKATKNTWSTKKSAKIHEFN